MNRMPPRIGTMEDVLAAMGDAQSHLLSAQLGNRIAFSQAVLTGRTAPELARRSAAAAEVEALRGEIDGLLAA
jgi:hypothetical protein